MLLEGTLPGWGPDPPPLARLSQGSQPALSAARSASLIARFLFVASPGHSHQLRRLLRISLDGEASCSL